MHCLVAVAFLGHPVEVSYIVFAKKYLEISNIVFEKNILKKKKKKKKKKNAGERKKSRKMSVC